MQFIDLQSQYKCLKDKIDARIHTVLDHGKYIMGPEVTELEEELANYLGVKHAITCANGTDALQLALMAMGIGSGDAVIIPPFTFFATAESVSIVGAEPVFSDIAPKTYNLCPIELEKTIVKYMAHGRKTLKAVMAVDLFGLPANYPEIIALCHKYKLLLIEDGAQGFGGSINGRKACTFGDISTTSFFPAKPLGSYGDGGAIFTDNDEYADILKSLRIHGKGGHKYDNVRIGMNSRLDTIQAAILLEKLAVFDNEILARNMIASKYTNAFETKLTSPVVLDKFKSAWAQYSISSENIDRNHIMEKLKEKGIPSNVYYPQGLHLSGAMKNLNYQKGDFPVTENTTQSIFSLPMHPYLKEVDQNVIIDNMLEIIK
ncbi:MAG: DegT/DnrJ/EryC1/StrS family aminotransferase [Colwellia sp.]|nr:DegT/DnrJ/EryC1/StrS family aminotransferase [Colwellia sp.]